MFTGLVSEIGIIKKIKPIKEGLELLIEQEGLIPKIKIGDSVALDGVCQTVTSFSDKHFSVQAVQTTISKTTFKKLSIGHKVNLELALRAGDRLGGHYVQGHVNSTAKLKSCKKNGHHYFLEFSIEHENLKYVVEEGSVTLNGISLTVAKICEFSKSLFVSIIPHTYEFTNLNNLKAGDLVNIEFDIISKYVENMLKYEKNNKVITNDWLKRKGF